MYHALMPLDPDKTEDSNQILAFNHIKRSYPDISAYWHHSPNGGSRKPSEGHRFKMMGTRAGIPDMLCFAARGPYRGCAVELKMPRGKLSPLQSDWLALLESQGWYVKVAYGYEETKKAIDFYCTLPIN